MSKISYLILLLLLAMSTGCATIMSDNKSFTQINSDPSGAECTVEGINFKQAITTPANVLIPAKSSPISIACILDKHYPASQNIEAKMDGTIFGNILFGGIIGVVIDATNKSGYKYPEQIMLTFYKQEFESEEERETWYNSKKNAISQPFDAQIEKIQTTCQDNDATCTEKINKLRESREEELKRLEAFYQESKVKEQELEQHTKDTDSFLSDTN